MWLLRCDCGNDVIRQSSVIVKAANDSKPSSCGCGHHLKTHGLSCSHRHLHWVWKAMQQRCGNPANKDYPNYGARGISICNEWQDFEQFASWAASTGYQRGLTVERQDVNGNYEPANCEWIANPLQARNRRHTHTYTHEGKTLDIRGWSEVSGIPYYALRSRLINYKWPIERAISESAKVRA